MSSARYRGYAGLLGLVVLAALLAHAIFDSSIDPSGVAPGQRLAPFAAPLALSSLTGAADIATHADDGEEGRVPACAERGPRILNVCQLYEQGPLVLALFVDAGSCASVLASMQALAPAFPGVRFAAVAIRPDRGRLRAFLRERRLTLPVGVDSDGAVAALYEVYSCPQVDFAYRGGVVQGRALLSNPSPARLRARVAALAAAQRARDRRDGGAA